MLLCYTKGTYFISEYDHTFLPCSKHSLFQQNFSMFNKKLHFSVCLIMNTFLMNFKLQKLLGARELKHIVVQDYYYLIVT